MKIRNAVIALILILIVLADFIGSFFLINKELPWDNLLKSPKNSSSPTGTVITGVINRPLKPDVEIKQPLSFSAVDLPYERITAGTETDMSCDYKNPNSTRINILSEMIFVSAGKIFNTSGSEKSLFLAGQKYDDIIDNSGRLKIKFKVPDNLPDGNYSLLFNVYNRKDKLLGACSSNYVRVVNQKPLVYLKLMTEDRLSGVKSITKQDELVYVRMYSNSDFNPVRAKIVLAEPMDKSKIIYNKIFDEINLKKFSTTDYPVKLDFFVPGIYYFYMELIDKDEKPISVMPQAGLFLGEKPEILSADVEAIRDDSYNLRLKYNSDLVPVGGLSLMSVVCDGQDCDFNNTLVKDKLPDLIPFTGTKNSKNKYKVNLKIKPVGINGYISSYIKSLK